MYNSTPHSVTGKSPAELFYRRQFRDKFPSIVDVEFAEVDSETRDKDTEMKAKGKEYADRRRHATESTLQGGEKVYVENMTKDNKLSTMFNDVPHTIINKEGNDVELQNDDSGQRLRRNVVHLKRVEGQWKVCEDGNQKDCVDTNDNNDDHKQTT
ncbi:jg25083 [Pararge aegeria aegeria]|uniref:Jg25083 protein n=1 Tax=Pararge aegeria aegeria TaxID=348720 RepID=A0A8S4QGR0_9NEOP|nr:jg25083 [Pararge aegeria aegeria]